MTHAEACRAGFERAGLWHVIGELRRLEHFTRTGRWQPAPEAVPFFDLLVANRPDTNPMRLEGVTAGGPVPWELPPGRFVPYQEDVVPFPGAIPMKAMGVRYVPNTPWEGFG